MSEEEENFVTHDNVGIKPTITLFLPVIWTNTGPDDYFRNNVRSIIFTPNVRDWDSFRRELFSPSSHSINDLVTYIDSDDDEIPIESQCELDEALRIATRLATQTPQAKSLHLVVDRGFKPRSKNTKEQNASNRRCNLLAMLPTNLNDDSQDVEYISSENATSRRIRELESSGDAAPKWFTNYMNKMKEDIVAEVSKRVTKTVLEALRTKREFRYDLVNKRARATKPDYFTDWNPKHDEGELRLDDLIVDCCKAQKNSEKSSQRCHVVTKHRRVEKFSDPEYVMDSDSDEFRSKIVPTDGFDHTIKSESSLFRSCSDHCRGNSRRRYLSSEKQRKKQKQSVTKVPTNLNNTSQGRCASSLSNRAINPKNRQTWEREDSRLKSPQPSFEKYGILEQDSSEQNESNTENMNTNDPRLTVAVTQQCEELSLINTTLEDAENKNCEELDTPYRRMIASGIRQMSFTPVDSIAMLDAPVLKVRLADSCEEDTSDVEIKATDEKLRTTCSTTGNDLFERENDRDLEYCVLSDSDNISVISDVSHNSDMQKITNSFEMILDRSMKFHDETDDDPEFFVTTEYEKNNNEDRVNEDIDAAHDSSSFELLSEPVSPPLSIHMEEDHFSTNMNETKNYNINDDATVFKQKNKNKIEESSILAIDTQGKIYQCNIIETHDGERTEIILEKRTDGAYSFVADTLPGSTKENTVRCDPCKCSSEDTITGTDNCASETESEPTEKCPEKPIVDEEKPIGNLSDSFHESTQSFHSHTASQMEKERQDVAGYSSRLDERNEIPNATRPNIFVDHNVSKGLGDTRQSSPRKQDFDNNKRHGDFIPGRSRTPKKHQNNLNHGSSTKKNGNPRPGERTTRNANWSTAQSTRIVDDSVLKTVDPLQILPEVLVTSAVQVAANAYTTARRVYDRILTAQTRKPADKSKFGRR